MANVQNAAAGVSREKHAKREKLPFADAQRRVPGEDFFIKQPKQSGGEGEFLSRPFKRFGRRRAVSPVPPGGSDPPSRKGETPFR